MCCVEVVGVEGEVEVVLGRGVVGVVGDAPM